MEINCYVINLSEKVRHKHAETFFRMEKKTFFRMEIN